MGVGAKEAVDDVARFPAVGLLVPRGGPPVGEAAQVLLDVGEEGDEFERVYGFHDGDV